MNNSSGNAQVVQTFFQKLPLTLCGAFCLKKIYIIIENQLEKNQESTIANSDTTDGKLINLTYFPVSVMC